MKLMAAKIWLKGWRKEVYEDSESSEEEPMSIEEENDELKNELYVVKAENVKLKESNKLKVSIWHR